MWDQADDDERYAADPLPGLIIAGIYGAVLAVMVIAAIYGYAP